MIPRQPLRYMSAGAKSGRNIQFLKDEVSGLESDYLSDREDFYLTERGPSCLKENIPTDDTWTHSPSGC